MHNNDKKLILKFNSKLFEIILRNTETAKLIAKSIPIIICTIDKKVFVLLGNK